MTPAADHPASPARAAPRGEHADPNDRTQWAPGDRYAIHPATTPFALETTQGTVYVPVGQYGRFLMTAEGWTVDAE